MDSLSANVNFLYHGFSKCNVNSESMLQRFHVTFRQSMLHQTKWCNHLMSLYLPMYCYNFSNTFTAILTSILRSFNGSVELSSTLIALKQPPMVIIIHNINNAKENVPLSIEYLIVADSRGLGAKIC